MRASRAIGQLAGGAGLLLVGAAAAPAAFVDVTAQVGVQVEHSLGANCGGPALTAGGAWADYDADGDLDLYLTNHGGANHLFRNDGDDNGDSLPEFVDRAQQEGVADASGVGLGTVFVDYDNDGDQDLLVLDLGGNRLFQNRLTETGRVDFRDVTNASGLRNGGRAITAAWGDFDEDGLLDVYLAKHGECSIDEPNAQDALYKNNGDGSFADVTDWLCGTPALCPQVLQNLGFSPGWLDYDNDGDLDLYVVNDDIEGAHYPNTLWRNDGTDGKGGWKFTDVSVSSGTNISLNGMGLGVGDIDNDGWLDLAFSNIGANYLLRNRGDGTFFDFSADAGIQRAFTPAGDVSITWGTVFFDYDNDRWLDLFIAAGYIDVPPFTQPDAFFRNTGVGTFVDLSAESGVDHPGRGRHASIADFDADGFVDLLVGNYGEPAVLYHNNSLREGNANHRLVVTLAGTASNRDGIGTRLWLETGDGIRQMREITSGPTHGGGDQRAAFFGLGPYDSGQLVVRWPNGAAQDLGQVAADQRLHLRQPEFLLAAPEPGRAGQVNTLEVTGAGPDADLVLVRGASPGETVIPGCGGIAVALEAPMLRDEVTADGGGSATFSDFVPGLASGRTGYYQAVDAETCEVSNRVWFHFP